MFLLDPPENQRMFSRGPKRNNGKKWVNTIFWNVQGEKGWTQCYSNTVFTKSFESSLYSQKSLSNSTFPLCFSNKWRSLLQWHFLKHQIHENNVRFPTLHFVINNGNRVKNCGKIQNSFIWDMKKVSPYKK